MQGYGVSGGVHGVPQQVAGFAPQGGFAMSVNPGLPVSAHFAQGAPAGGNAAPAAHLPQSAYSVPAQTATIPQHAQQQQQQQHHQPLHQPPTPQPPQHQPPAAQQSPAYQQRQPQAQQPPLPAFQPPQRSDPPATQGKSGWGKDGGKEGGKDGKGKGSKGKGEGQGFKGESQGFKGEGFGKGGKQQPSGPPSRTVTLVQPVRPYRPFLPHSTPQSVVQQTLSGQEQQDFGHASRKIRAFDAFSLSKVCEGFSLMKELERGPYVQDESVSAEFLATLDEGNMRSQVFDHANNVKTKDIPQHVKRAFMGNRKLYHELLSLYPEADHNRYFGLRILLKLLH